MDMQEMSFQNVIDNVLKPAGVKVGGYPDDIFVELGDDERERWQCSICYLVSRQAKECDNGHLFCTTCVFAWSMTYGANSDKCPVCRSKQPEYRPRAEIDESIGHKRVRCPEPACSFRAPLTYLLKHSHGAERFGSGSSSADLERLRRSRPAPVNPFMAGSGVIFLPLLRAPAGAAGGGREGRSLLQDMMMVLHLEMELRRRAIERFSSEEDHVERVRHMTEVLAIQEQMQEITGFLNLLFSVTPQQRRNDPARQDSRLTELGGTDAAGVAESGDDEDNDGNGDDDDDSSSDSDETSITALLSSRRERAPLAGPSLAGRRQPEPAALHQSASAAPHLPSPAHVLAPVPPSVPRQAAAAAAAAAAGPRGRWRADDGAAQASPGGSYWSTSGDSGSGGGPAAAAVPPPPPVQSLGASRHVRLPSPQPPNVQASPGALHAAAPLLRPPLVPHPPLAPPPPSSFAANEHPESTAASGSAAIAGDTPASGLSLPRRTPRMDEGRSGDIAASAAGLAPAGSATFQAAMRQLPPINRASAAMSVSPSPRLSSSDTPSVVDLIPAPPLPPPPRERTIFSSRRNDSAAAPEPSAPAAAAAAGGGDGGLAVSRGARRVVRRRKVAHDPPDIQTPSRREPEPPAGGGPVTRSRSQLLGNTAASRNGLAGAGGASRPGGEQHQHRSRLSRTRGIDLMLSTKDRSSSQRR